MLIDCLTKISVKVCCIFLYASFQVSKQMPSYIIITEIQLQLFVSLPQLYVFKSGFLRGCKSFDDPTLSIPPFEGTKSTSTIELWVFVVPPCRSQWLQKSRSLIVQCASKKRKGLLILKFDSSVRRTMPTFAQLRSHSRGPFSRTTPSVREEEQYCQRSSGPCLLMLRCAHSMDSSLI